MACVKACFPFLHGIILAGKGYVVQYAGGSPRVCQRIPLGSSGGRAALQEHAGITHNTYPPTRIAGSWVHESEEHHLTFALSEGFLIEERSGLYSS